MQGRLRKAELSVKVETECAHCGRQMKLDISSDLNCRVRDEGCAPVIFVPHVDLYNLKDKSIINAF